MNIKKGRTFICTFLFLLFTPPVYLLADTANTQKVLSQFQFESHSIQGDVGRQIGWSIITGLHWLVKGIEGVIYNINSTVGDFFRSADVTKIQNDKIAPLTIALLALIILFVGIMSMIKPRNFSTIAGNLVIGAVIFVGLPAFLSGAYNLTNEAIKFLNSNPNGVSTLMSDRILVDNITDNTMYDASGFRSIAYKNNYATHGNVDQIEKIDPTETIDPSKMKHSDVWKNKLTYDKNGKQTLTALWDGKVGPITIPSLSQYYYRWNIDWFTIISTLLITAVALVLSGIKIARLLYELAINQTLTQFVALFDIMTAQRVRKCLQMLLSTLLTLFSVFFMLQLYIIGMAYIAAKTSNVILRLILMLALAWSVIDGPDLFERVFGIDEGVHNALSTMYGLKTAGDMAAGGVALMGGKGLMDSLRTKGILGTARMGAGKIGSFAGGAGGMAAGFGKGVADNHSRYSAARNGQSVAGAVSGIAAGAVSAASANTDSGGQESTDMPNRMNDSTSNQVPGQNENAETINQTAKPAGANTVDQAAETVQGNVNASTENVARNNETPLQSGVGGSGSSGNGTSSTQSSNKKPEDTVAAQTIGSYIGGRISNGFRQSGAARSAHRMYNLAYGSRIAHGDKQIARIGHQQQSPGVKPYSHQTNQTIMPNQENITENDGQKDHMQQEKSWSEQEYELEHRQNEETGPEKK